MGFGPRSFVKSSDQALQDLKKFIEGAFQDNARLRQIVIAKDVCFAFTIYQEGPGRTAGEREASATKCLEVKIKEGSKLIFFTTGHSVINGANKKAASNRSRFLLQQEGLHLTIDLRTGTVTRRLANAGLHGQPRVSRHY